MKISIITVCRNAGEGLELTSLSVTNQKDAGYELIIIDRGFSVNSLKVIKKYEQLISYWVSEKDTGIYNAINKGIAKATGNILLFLNSNDVFYDQNFLKNAMEIIYPFNASYLYAFDMLFGNHKKTSCGFKNHKSFKGTCFLYQATIVPTETFQQLCLYDENFTIAGDYEWCLRARNKGTKPIFIPTILSKMDTTGIGSSLKWKDISFRLKEKRRAFLNNCQ